MIKDLWTRFLGWVKGFPWKIGIAAVIVGELVVIFLVEGKVYLWDYFYMGAFTLAMVFISWKLAKREK
jgi:hypothetical protein